MTYHTEPDARDMRCCGPEGCGEARRENIPLTPSEPRYCIASACMAWRWSFDEATVGEFQRGEFEEKGYHAFALRSVSGIPAVTMRRQTAYGYCGFAGEPQ